MATCWRIKCHCCLTAKNKTIQERLLRGPFLFVVYLRCKFNTMKKFLQFIDAADDAATYPADNLIAMTVAVDATLILKFSPGSLGSVVCDDVNSLFLHSNIASCTITLDA